jgi:hypothetical protein
MVSSTRALVSFTERSIRSLCRLCSAPYDLKIRLRSARYVYLSHSSAVRVSTQRLKMGRAGPRGDRSHAPVVLVATIYARLAIGDLLRRRLEPIRPPAVSRRPSRRRRPAPRRRRAATAAWWRPAARTSVVWRRTVRGASVERALACTHAGAARTAARLGASPRQRACSSNFTVLLLRLPSTRHSPLRDNRRHLRFRERPRVSTRARNFGALLVVLGPFYTSGWTIASLTLCYKYAVLFKHNTLAYVAHPWRV